MAAHVANSFFIDLKGNLLHDYRQVWLMAASAIALSSTTIIYYNHKMYYEQIANVYGTVELAAITLMPYMISAVIATITSIGIMSMLPMINSSQEARKIHVRVKQMSEGDLTTASRLDCKNPHLKDIAGELNYVVGFLGSSVAQWKIINRQQWDLLESARQAAIREDHCSTLKLIEKMEENWRMTAAIENRFRT